MYNSDEMKDFVVVVFYIMYIFETLQFFEAFPGSFLVLFTRSSKSNNYLTSVCEQISLLKK